MIYKLAVFKSLSDDLNVQLMVLYFETNCKLLLFCCQWNSSLIIIIGYEIWYRKSTVFLSNVRVTTNHVDYFIYFNIWIRWRTPWSATCHFVRSNWAWLVPPWSGRYIECYNHKCQLWTLWNGLNSIDG